jgi:Ca2+/Na+ antiporter
MSFGDHAVLWLHITAAVFTIGPGTAAIMSTPRFIRRRNPMVVGYLFRTTRIYSFASLLTLIFGIALTSMTHQWSQWWVTVSLTLFVVAFVLLFIIMRDQRKALRALEAMDSAVRGDDGEMPTIRSSVEGQVPMMEPAGTGPVATETGTTETGTTETAVAESGTAEVAAAPEPATAAGSRAGQPSVTVSADVRVAAVERGRIASFGGVTALIWLVVLVLMVWH